MIGVVLVMAVAPSLFRGCGRGGCGRPEVIANVKSLGLALFNFEQDFGKYPDASTIELVRKEDQTSLSLGTKSSNDFFRQLIAAGYTDSEKIFYAKIKGSKMPDNVMSGSHALEKGECGFSYMVGLDNAGNSGRPILVTPLIPGTNRFDPIPFKGKAIILRIDNTCSVEPINKRGEVIDSSGKHILDPANPIWGGKPPVIAWPE